MSVVTKDRNYDLVGCGPWGQQPGCLNQPFYKMNAPDSDKAPVCPNDNRSYAIYSTNSCYSGYYDAQCNDKPNTYMPCDLRYVFAPPKVTLDCWDKCQTKDCHVNCVVNAKN